MIDTLTVLYPGNDITCVVKGVSIGVCQQCPDKKNCRTVPETEGKFLSFFGPSLGQELCVHGSFNRIIFTLLMIYRDDFLISLHIYMCLYGYHNNKQAEFLIKKF